MSTKKRKLHEPASQGFHSFGSDHPHGMPPHFLHGAVHIDYETAERADISRQDFSVAPRHWYLDVTFICQRCHEKFVWTRGEQRFWFEELQLWIDSHPFLCRQCRATKREITELRRLYDAGIAAALASRDVSEKECMIQAMSDYQTLVGVLPSRMAENLALLERHLQNLRRTA